MEKISQEEQQLLDTDFGEEIEKQAAARASAINDAYNYGFSKEATQLANEMDKLAEEAKEEEEEEEEEMDEESEKAAAELGAFIERGFFDGLRKLGSDRHGNELHYLQPYIEEKIAVSAAMKSRAVMERLSRRAKGLASKVKDSELGKKVKSHAQRVKSKAQYGVKDIAAAARGKKDVFGVAQDMAPGERSKYLKSGLKGVAPAAAYAAGGTAAVGGGGYGAYKAMSGNKDKK